MALNFIWHICHFALKSLGIQGTLQLLAKHIDGGRGKLSTVEKIAFVKVRQDGYIVYVYIHTHLYDYFLDSPAISTQMPYFLKTFKHLCVITATARARATQGLPSRHGWMAGPNSINGLHAMLT
jgi:hypothetical protein